jgi:hypothetical protein
MAQASWLIYFLDRRDAIATRSTGAAKIAMGYRGCGVPIAEVISEGNF